MEFRLRKNSLVILAENHNPTLLTDLFLLKAKFIESPSEIDRRSYILTPALERGKIKKVY